MTRNQRWLRHAKTHWLSAVLLIWLELPAQAHAVREIPLVVHAEDVSDAWLDARVAAANRLFLPMDVRFVVARRLGLAPQHHELETRRDRHRLRQHWAPKAVHVFVVNRLMDVDEPGRVRNGVHWKARDRQGKRVDARYVILAEYSGPFVLAHELGHYFGHRRHVRAVDNLMSYARSGTRDPFLTAEQQSLIRAGLEKAFPREARGLRRSSSRRAEAGSY